MCATDFSLAETAVQLASALSRRTSSPLLLLHAVEPPTFDLLALGASFAAPVLIERSALS